MIEVCYVVCIAKIRSSYPMENVSELNAKKENALNKLDVVLWMPNQSHMISNPALHTHKLSPPHIACLEGYLRVLEEVNEMACRSKRQWDDMEPCHVRTSNMHRPTIGYKTPDCLTRLPA